MRPDFGASLSCNLKYRECRLHLQFVSPDWMAQNVVDFNFDTGTGLAG
jgi:hypothetical protein